MADVIVEPHDQRIVLYGVTYEQYVQVADVFAERHIRFTYADGALEIMTPGPHHEVSKKLIARLLELYALVRGIRIYAYGDLTMRNALTEVGLEPDECYCVGGDKDVGIDKKDVPDLAIEVVVSHRLNKLPIYARLGVAEVWVWAYRRERFEIHRLVGGAYQLVDTSQFFPQLDLRQLEDYIAMPDQDAAVRAYWARLSG
jgi:Uma2 family endonuclease